MTHKSSFYVRGGLYENDEFSRAITPDPPLGPFADWEAAYRAWEDISWRHLDDALRRYYISDEHGSVIKHRPQP